ncbi:WD repeat-containing protein 3 [Platysternon megacephalum]|uniref:WD repeat-containing protein 3 n=1 Tax=Platysternon megacephalum TaxID=55544 RepID=A0A4D9EA09_9SAUR|nr:WD repeat-containing protein 3 [Platysternon megacephalum]
MSVGSHFPPSATHHIGENDAGNHRAYRLLDPSTMTDRVTLGPAAFKRNPDEGAVQSFNKENFTFFVLFEVNQEFHWSESRAETGPWWTVPLNTFPVCSFPMDLQSVTFPDPTSIHCQSVADECTRGLLPWMSTAKSHWLPLQQNEALNRNIQSLMVLKQVELSCPSLLVTNNNQTKRVNTQTFAFQMGSVLRSTKPATYFIETPKTAKVQHLGPEVFVKMNIPTEI